MDEKVQHGSPRTCGLTEVVGRAASTGLALVLLSSVLAGVPAAAAAPACTSGVTGDVNGDGHAEVAIGEPGNGAGAGVVHVLYGTTGGLVTGPTGSALNDQYLSQGSAGVPGTAEHDDLFGLSTLLADFDGDGCADLAVGAPGERGSRGSLTVLYGSPAGLTTTRAASWTENSLFGTGAALIGERFGTSLATGDLDDDGIADLVVGAPAEVVAGQSGGAAVMLLGSATGLGGRPATTALLSQATAGVPGAPEEGDGFGAALAVGDFDGDSVDDLAVGVPGESNHSGVVDVLPGRAPDGAGHLPGVVVQQNTADVPGQQEGGDAFGAALAAGDVGGDARDDLAVGLPGENGSSPEPGLGQGAVVLLPGSATGLTGAGSQLWTQGSPGVEGVSGDADQFGSALTMGRFDNGPLADLAVGTRGDAIGSVREAGSVTVLMGSEDGLSTEGPGGSRFSQDVQGLSGSAESGDAFGYALVAAAVQTRDQDNLVVGVPGESVRRTGDGMVQQLATNEFGPNPVGSRTLHQDTAGLQGVPGTGNAFGFDLG